MSINSLSKASAQFCYKPKPLYARMSHINHFFLQLITVDVSESID